MPRTHVYNYVYNYVYMPAHGYIQPSIECIHTSLKLSTYDIHIYSYTHIYISIYTHIYTYIYTYI